MNTSYCRKGNVKLFFTNEALYFVKYKHPKQDKFWLFCLIISRYRRIVIKVAQLPHLYFTLFCSLMSSLKLKTKT